MLYDSILQVGFLDRLNLWVGLFEIQLTLTQD